MDDGNSSNRISTRGISKDNTDLDRNRVEIYIQGMETSTIFESDDESSHLMSPLSKTALTDPEESFSPISTPIVVQLASLKGQNAQLNVTIAELLQEKNELEEEIVCMDEAYQVEAKLAMEAMAKTEALLTSMDQLQREKQEIEEALESIKNSFEAEATCLADTLDENEELLESLIQANDQSVELLALIAHLKQEKEEGEKMIQLLKRDKEEDNTMIEQLKHCLDKYTRHGRTKSLDDFVGLLNRLNYRKKLDST
jgi:chromosome segregation ATPase